MNPDRVATRLQYDYCAAYLDFFADDPGKARAIAERYADHPVDRWRNAFPAIVHQLDEADGKTDSGRRRRRPQPAAGPPGRHGAGLRVHAGRQGDQLDLAEPVETVRINYYLMDVELLFSRNPFVQQFGGQFATIRPNATREVSAAGRPTRLTIPLPDDLAGRNVLVEVTAAGKTRALPYYANAMDVRLTENYGQLRAADAAGKPLAKVYVKVYARLADGQVKFHKDGYTDHRGPVRLRLGEHAGEAADQPVLDPGAEHRPRGPGPRGGPAAAVTIGLRGQEFSPIRPQHFAAGRRARSPERVLADRR